MMAMKLTTEAVKMRFPSVSNISTDELLQLLNAGNSKVVLLVSGMLGCIGYPPPPHLSSALTSGLYAAI